MHIKILHTIAVALMCWLTGVAGIGDVAAQDTTLDFFGEIDDREHPPGYREFIENGCWQCHGFQGQGGARSGDPRLAPNPLPYEGFAHQVRTPRSVMPAYPPNMLSDENLRSIYTYLESIPQSPAVSDIPLLSEK